MAVIFPRGADEIVRRSVVAILVALGLTTMGWYYYALPSYTRVGYQPSQPVPFDHKRHVAQLGLDCRYCHSRVFDSPTANVPAAQTCMNCHNPQKANVKGDSPQLALVRESFQTGRAVEWRRVHKLPEFAYFNHASHVNKGVSCVSCHGQVNEMQVVWHEHTLSMGWCLSCHNDPKRNLRPVERVTDLAWIPDRGHTADEVGQRLVREFKVSPPTSCQGCHR